MNDFTHLLRVHKKSLCVLVLCAISAWVSIDHLDKSFHSFNKHKFKSSTLLKEIDSLKEQLFFINSYKNLSPKYSALKSFKSHKFSKDHNRRSALRFLYNQRKKLRLQKLNIKIDDLPTTQQKYYPIKQNLMHIDFQTASLNTIYKLIDRIAYDFPGAIQFEAMDIVPPQKKNTLYSARFKIKWYRVTS